MASRRMKKRRRSPLRHAMKLLYSLIVALSALVVVGFCAYRLVSRAPEQAPPPQASTPSADPVQVAQVDGAGQPQAGGPARKPQCYTVLLVCPDQTSGNADAITVAMYDTLNQQAGLISIPRDTMTQAYPKINAAFHKGPEHLRQVVSDLLGIPLDYYIAIDIRGFEALVDEVGGVDFNIPVRMAYDDPTQNLSIHYNPGPAHLNGKQAMEVCRFRKNNDGSEGWYTDVNRGETRNQILGAIMTKVLSSPGKISDYINLFSTYVKSDMPLEVMLWFAQPILGLDLSTGLKSGVLPGDGLTTYKGVRYCYQLYPRECLEMMNQILNPYTTDMTPGMMNIFQVK